ncbi:MAG: YHS domain-containing (seleno)protein [Cyclobacteriaceae bacterium]
MKAKTVFICSLLLSVSVFGQKSEVFSTNAGAIKGYDPVAYFTQGEAIEGDEKFSFEWKGAVWHFSSEENMNTFMEKPESYAPQFGGYCAWAVSQGYTYRTSPEAWKIVDGKLYLNYSVGVQKKWEANQTELIKSGEANWPKVLEK